MIYAGQGQQGWYNPLPREVIVNDHTSYFQINIEPIVDAFYQNKGQIYWLEIKLPNDTTPNIGWKTSIEHFMDDAVYYPLGGPGYQELRYPPEDLYGRGGQSIDLAFVITPEPATIALFALGLLALRKK